MRESNSPSSNSTQDLMQPSLWQPEGSLFFQHFFFSFLKRLPKRTVPTADNRWCWVVVGVGEGGGRAGMLIPGGGGGGVVGER